MDTRHDVVVTVPDALRGYAGGAETLRVAAGTVRAALAAIEAEHPAFVRRVLTRDGVLRPYVRMFVRSADVRDLDGLDTALAAGETLIIVPSVAGG